MKSIFLLLLLMVFTTDLYSQQIDEGKYNDWDFGPNGVYGNLPLSNITSRWYYKIEKKTAETVMVKNYNPSGVVVSTATVTFKNGILSDFTNTDQWGETSEERKYVQKDNNEFIVTDIVQGTNDYLPCKYAIHKYKNKLLTEVQFYSFTDKLMENKNGYAIIRYDRYDDKIRFAEIKKTSFYDAEGLPIISKVTGYHSGDNEFDEHNNKIKESYLGTQNQPIRIQITNSAKILNFYDNNNNKVKTEFLDIDNSIKTNINGISSTEIQYLNGYPVELIRYDSLHHVTRASTNGDGVSIIKQEFDGSGNKTKIAYFNEEENPMTDPSGIHEIIYSFSASNMLAQTAFFDDFEKPSINRDSAHTINYIRDKKGRVVQQSSYDIEGNPLKNFTDEVYMLKFKYDEFGRRVSTSYWQDSITKMPRWNGAYELKTKFNNDGQPTEYGFFDDSGNPFITSDSTSTSKLLYNSEGRIYERQFLNNDILVNRQDGATLGYSIIKYGYDKSGKVNELTFFDNNRQAVNATMYFDDSFPAHRVVCIYKGQRIIEEQFYEINTDNPTRIIDCLKNDFLAANGISTGRKNVY